MLRRLSLVVAVLALGAGCDGRVDLLVDVNESGAGTLEVVAVLDSEAQALTGSVDLDERARSLMPGTWVVEPTAAEGRRGVRMTRRFADPLDLGAAVAELAAATNQVGLGPPPTIEVVGAGDGSPHLTVAVPELSLVPGPDSPGAGISAELGGPAAAESRRLRVVARLPGRITDTSGGGGGVVDGGAVTWELTGGEPAQLTATSDTRSTFPTGRVVGAAALGAVVAALVWRRRSARRQPAMR